MTKQTQKTMIDLVGGLSKDYWVQKADPLVAMRSVPFSLGELKIIDTYISRINAADDTRRTVIFTKEEYEELMGLTCANPRALQKHIKALLSRVPELYFPDDGYISFVLFEKAYYHKDEYGKPVVELTCTETSKDLFFCIGKYHYFKYALENVINLTRKASYLLYLHIIINRYRSEWDIDLAELRDNILDCKEQESYQEYKIFKNRVLDPAVKEVNEKTDCRFTYEPIKRGRRVAKIKFTYQSIADELPQQLSLLDASPASEPENEDDNAAFLAEACNKEFSLMQMHELIEIMSTMHLTEHEHGVWVARYHYLSEKYARLNVAAERRSIKDRFGYLRKMILNDRGE